MQRFLEKSKSRGSNEFKEVIYFVAIVFLLFGFTFMLTLLC